MDLDWIDDFLETVITTLGNAIISVLTILVDWVIANPASFAIIVMLSTVLMVTIHYLLR